MMVTMATVKDVAAFILDLGGPMTAMKLQKLCYHALGYHMAWEGRLLFPEHFEAWANGPVAPALYRCHRGRLTLRSGDIPGDPTALDAGERESVEIVVDNLRDLSAHQLSAMTHTQAPWQQARARAGVGELERSNEPLLNDEIQEYFEAVVNTAE